LLPNLLIFTKLILVYKSILIPYKKIRSHLEAADIFHFEAIILPLFFSKTSPSSIAYGSLIYIN